MILTAQESLAAFALTWTKTEHIKNKAHERTLCNTFSNKLNIIDREKEMTSRCTQVSVEFFNKSSFWACVQKTLVEQSIICMIVEYIRMASGWMLSSFQPWSLSIYSYICFFYALMPPIVSLSVSPLSLFSLSLFSLSLSLSLLKLKLFSVKHKRASLIKVHPTFIKNLFSTQLLKTNWNQKAIIIIFCFILMHAFYVHNHLHYIIKPTHQTPHNIKVHLLDIIGIMETACTAVWARNTRVHS